MDHLTRDTLFNGSIHMKQHRSGYRYTIDPVLLAHFSAPEPGNTVIDLGTGSGIIPVILSHRVQDVSIWAVEIQTALVTLARNNIRENGFDDRVTLIEGDMSRPGSLPIPQGMDLVVSNPPYTPVHAGRLNPADEKAVARHELSCSLEQLLKSVHYFLKDRGRFTVIYPQNRLVDLLTQLRTKGLEPRTLRCVHPLAGGPAKRVLVEAVKGAGPALTVLPPLCIYQTPGCYSDEVSSMFA
jgi:tRNA1Val (adenine37-N6)-methyltransferase